MKKTLMVVASAAALWMTSAVAMADNLKIGVVDIQQVMQQSKQVSKMKDEISKEFKPRQSKIVDAQKNVQSEIDKLNRNGATMTDADRSKAQNQIMDDRNNLQQMMASFQTDLNDVQTKDMQKFMDKLNSVIAGIAKTGSYDLILQRAAAQYAGSNLDVTPQVVQALNR